MVLRVANTDPGRCHLFLDQNILNSPIPFVQHLEINTRNVRTSMPLHQKNEGHNDKEREQNNHATRV